LKAIRAGPGQGLPDNQGMPRTLLRGLGVAPGRATTRQRRNELLVQIYRRLLDAYGPQHWWPADEPFEVMVGAVLTQSTAWANVSKAIRNLKEADAMSPGAIRRLGLDRLAVLIRPSGYYNVKSRKLMALVSWLGEHNDDLRHLFGESVTQLREELLQVYGIGEETADSILLYAGGKPVFVIDAYTRRITGRVGVKPPQDSYSGFQDLFESALPADARIFNEYHALLVEHGKRSCRKAPQCPQCALLELCRHGRALTRGSCQPQSGDRPAARTG
jgi:endonuclease-3 related protein